MVENKKAEVERLPKEALKEEAQRLFERALGILKKSPLFAQAVVETFFKSDDSFGLLPGKTVYFPGGNLIYKVNYKEGEENSPYGKAILSIERGVLSKDPKVLEKYRWPVEGKSEEVTLAILKDPTKLPDLVPAVIQYAEDSAQQRYEFQTNTSWALEQAKRFLEELEKDLSN